MGGAMGELGVANTILLLVKGILLQLENALYAPAPTLAGQQSERRANATWTRSGVGTEPRRTMEMETEMEMMVVGVLNVLGHWHNSDGIAVGHSL